MNEELMNLIEEYPDGILCKVLIYGEEIFKIIKKDDNLDTLHDAEEITPVKSDEINHYLYDLWQTELEK